MVSISLMRRLRLFAATTAVISLLAPAAAPQTPVPVARPKTAAPKYTVSDLGALPVIADDVSIALNASGQVSLWAEDQGQRVQAAVWTKGRWQALGSVAGCPTSIASDINDVGEVVGWVTTSNNPVDSLATVHAFVYRQGQMKSLGTLGGQDSRASAINSAGMIVGVSNRADGERHAFLFDGRTMTDLGTLPGARFSQAYAVNAKGHVAGVSEFARTHKHAVIWRSGHLTDLGTLPHGSTSVARAINNHDQVAGYAETPQGYHAFLYSGGRMQDLGTLGDDPSSAYGLNDQGAVVGASNISEHEHHAFLWQNGHLADLNPFIPTDSGWTLLQADAINSKGQIVCVGQGKDEVEHVLLLTPSHSIS